MAYIPHDQSPLDMFIELLNTVANEEVTKENVLLSNPSPTPPVGGRNTEVVVEAVEGEGFSGSVTTRHRRLDLASALNDLEITLRVPPSATYTHDCIDSFNERLGTLISEEDVENELIVGDEVTFRFRPECLAYLGDVIFKVNLQSGDSRPHLETVITTTQFEEFIDPGADYDAPPTVLLLNLIGGENGIVLSPQKYFFDIPEVYSGPENCNTLVTLYAAENAAYQGSVDVIYNRASLSEFFPAGIEVEDSPASTVKDLLPIVNSQVGLQLSEYDVVGGPFSSGDSLTASDHGVLLGPGSSTIVTFLVSGDSWLFVNEGTSQWDFNACGYGTRTVQALPFPVAEVTHEDMEGNQQEIIISISETKQLSPGDVFGAVIGLDAITPYLTSAEVTENSFYSVTFCIGFSGDVEEWINVRVGYFASFDDVWNVGCTVAKSTGGSEWSDEPEMITPPLANEGSLSPDPLTDPKSVRVEVKIKNESTVTLVVQFEGDENTIFNGDVPISETNEAKLEFISTYYINTCF